jgi:hypothetical protein
MSLILYLVLTHGGPASTALLTVAVNNDFPLISQKDHFAVARNSR